MFSRCLAIARSTPRLLLAALVVAPAGSGCSGNTHSWFSSMLHSAAASTTHDAAVAAPNTFVGLDRNDYPGDAAMAALHRTFAFTGYWITPPPETTTNTWSGKRRVLLTQGWGFLVLANGRLDAELLAAQKHGTAPATLAQRDAATAIASARHEGFHNNTILFLDQEEGGRMLPEQSAYILAWSQAVAASGFRPGLYASGQPVADGTTPGGQPATITTLDDIRSQVSAQHLHSIALFDAQDSCPPAPGCTVKPSPLNASGELSLTDPNQLTVWQYAQSPRRPEITQSCAATYAPDGNCYAPGFPQLFIDLDAASTEDPSQGR